MTDIAAAQATLVELQSKRDALVARGVELAEQRQQIAFAAHTGDQAARKKLDGINRESGMQASELESLDAAIAEATKRVVAAERVVAIQAERAAALDLRKVADELHAAGADAGFALEAFVLAADRLHEVADKLSASGAPPRHEQIISLGYRAIGTALMRTLWGREFEQVRPHERYTFPQLCDGWATQLQSAIDYRLGELDRQQQAAA
jgi:hypothetical protein